MQNAECRMQNCDICYNGKIVPAGFSFVLEYRSMLCIDTDRRDVGPYKVCGKIDTGR